MRGSIRQRGTTYTAYWFTNDPATGKRRQHSKGGFPTKKTAGDHLTQVLPKVADGSFVAPRRMTVEDYFNDEWLPAQRERGLRPTTLAQYEVVATKWIIPHIGGVQLGQVNPSVVQQAYETLRTSGRRPTKSSPERTGLGSRSVQRAAVVLKMALEHAVRQGVLARNAASLVSVPRVTQREMSTWASEQSREFLEHTGSDPLFAAWALFLCRGSAAGRGRRSPVGEYRPQPWPAADRAHPCRRRRQQGSVLDAEDRPGASQYPARRSARPGTAEAPGPPEGAQAGCRRFMGQHRLRVRERARRTVPPGPLLGSVPDPRRGSRPAKDPTPRRPAHRGKPDAGQRHSDEGCPGDPRSRSTEHHSGHVPARHAGNGRGGRGGFVSQPPELTSTTV